MRYVISMILAAIGFALAAFFVSSEVANWVVNRLTFESPDDADNLHMAVWIGTNVAGLIVGWLVGWIAAAPRSDPAH